MARRRSLRDRGVEWCLNHPEALLTFHESGRPFLALHPNYGVVVAAEDEEELEAGLNNLRPSVAKQLYRTCTSLWIHFGTSGDDAYVEA